MFSHFMKTTKTKAGNACAQLQMNIYTLKLQAVNKTTANLQPKSQWVYGNITVALMKDWTCSNSSIPVKQQNWEPLCNNMLSTHSIIFCCISVVHYYRMCLIIFRGSNERHPESKKFRKCYAVLQETIINQKLCFSLASAFYSNDLISKDIHRGNGSSQHVREILDAIEHQICIKPANLYKFRNILSGYPVLDIVCQKLQKADQVQPNPPSMPYEMKLQCYTDPLTGKMYNEMCESFRKALISSDANEMDRLTKRVMEDQSMKKDLKVFALCYQAIQKATVLNQLDKAEEILQRALKLTEETDTANWSLLQGKVFRILAGIPRRKGNYDMALEYIGKATRKFFVAVPSCETACVLMEEALILQLKNDVTVRQEEIKYKLISALDHSRRCPDHQRGRYTVSLTYLRTALFHLNSYTSWYEESRPQESSLKEAEECLQKVELNILSGPNAYEMEYRVAYSDLHRWRHKRTKAFECAEEARALQKKAKFADESFLNINRRVEMLKRT